MPTQLADHTLLLQGRRYPEARDLRRAKYEGCCSNINLLRQTIFENTAAHNSMRTAPWATVLDAAMEAVLTGISGMLLLSFLLSVLWLSCLRGVRSCGGHRGLGSRFWACFGCLCLLFFLVRIKPHPIVVLGRTQFRSQVEFCGLCSSLTCTPSALVRDSRAMIEPYILGWLTSSCLSTAMLPLLGVRSCGGHRGLVSRYWSCFGCPFLFFSLMVVLDRTHFRSQVEFCGLCSSITFGSSPSLSGYDRALHPG